MHMIFSYIIYCTSKRSNFLLMYRHIDKNFLFTYLLDPFKNSLSVHFNIATLEIPCLNRITRVS